MMSAEKSKKLAAVIGWPISHSKSPLIHGYWLEQYKIDGAYMAIPVSDNFLSMTIECIKDFGFSGFNVTVPHKEVIIDHLDSIDEMAIEIGAVNTVVRRDSGLLHGMNTDYSGFLQSIAAVEKIDKALVLGAGGAARAVCAALKKRGCEIIICNRSQAKAEQLGLIFGARVIAWEQREFYLGDIDLLVNATSLGMVGQPPLQIDIRDLKKSAAVTDIVYKPLVTNLLQQAKNQGHIVIDGLWMLLYQAAPAFEQFFGVAPTVTEQLRQLVLKE